METNKSKIKGPTMPPSHFDLDKIAQTSVANLKVLISFLVFIPCIFILI